MNKLRKELGIDDWLELVKEDQNLNGAYISFAQYIYILENQLKQRDEVIDEAINKLGRYADEMNRNGNAYAICVDLLDKLKKIQRR
ncbi:MAG: hypothetical protein HFI36_02725 [Bacilli bacterium]|jgi:hypothetical protein|nr:hypothetical protein [Bacilli bacterium]